MMGSFYIMHNHDDFKNTLISQCENSIFPKTCRISKVACVCVFGVYVYLFLCVRVRYQNLNIQVCIFSILNAEVFFSFL